jgi:enoyl-[acyl-carrier protein] reductase II
LTLKELAPVRLIRNKFYSELAAAYARCASVDELKQILGRARAKKGMFEGDLEDGELEIGQVSGIMRDIPAAATVVERMVSEFHEARERLNAFHVGGK